MNRKARMEKVRRRAAQERRRLKGKSQADVVCEEVMLDAFASKSSPFMQAFREKTQHPPRSDAPKVCIIGNSHIGALALAARERLFTDPSLDIVFWGFPGAAFRK